MFLYFSKTQGESFSVMEFGPLRRFLENVVVLCLF